MPRLALDTNLLLLLIVGLTNKSWISRHKRTKMFDDSDYDLLVDFLSKYDEIIITPHILTETDNLLIHQNDPKVADQLRNTLKVLVEDFYENSETGVMITKESTFLRLGIADCAILRSTRKSETLLTSDLDLYLAAQNQSKEAVNFNHYRI